MSDPFTLDTDPIVVPMCDGEIEAKRPQYWRDRAEEARAKAALMRDANARMMMESIAANYDKLADRAVRRRF